MCLRSLFLHSPSHQILVDKPFTCLSDSGRAEGPTHRPVSTRTQGMQATEDGPEREAIELFKAWSKGRLRYTGRGVNANKMAHILPLYQGFIRNHVDFWQSNFGYTFRGANPGPLSKTYPLFRDRILPQSLAEMRGGEPPKFVMKRTPRVRDGRATPRAISGWEIV